MSPPQAVDAVTITASSHRNLMLPRTGACDECVAAAVTLAVRFVKEY
jgi:hypothetical protein